jgi:hypothetical protein
VNVTGLEVPPAVVIVTWADDTPLIGGTVTVQVFWAGQLVGATWPLKLATIWPLELRKLDPATCTPCPAAAVGGEIEAMTGAPPGVAGGVVEVVVVGGVAPPLFPVVFGFEWCTGEVVPVWAVVAGVDGGDAAC